MTDSGNCGARTMEDKNRPVSPINGQPLPVGKPFGTSDERAKEAGIASGKARRRKADLREMAQAWLETEIKDTKGKTMTGAELMLAVAARELSKGNPRFWELMRDTAGQKPVEKVMIADVDQSVIDEVEAMVNDPSTGG